MTIQILNNMQIAVCKESTIRAENGLEIVLVDLYGNLTDATVILNDTEYEVEGHLTVPFSSNEKNTTVTIRQNDATYRLGRLVRRGTIFTLEPSRPYYKLAVACAQAAAAHEDLYKKIEALTARINAIEGR